MSQITARGAMPDRLYFYSLLVLGAVIQVAAGNYFSWFPDIVLVLVVFSGMYRGFTSGALTGLAGGFLRGLFSAGTMPVEMAAFAMAGALSAFLAGKLDRQNPAAQVVITASAVFFVMVSEVFFLSLLYENEISIPHVLSASLGGIFSTVAVAPFVFPLIKERLSAEE